MLKTNLGLLSLTRKQNRVDWLREMEKGELLFAGGAAMFDR